MIDPEAILNNLHKLLEESQASNKVDETVDFIANKGRRISLVEGIMNVEDRLADLWRRQMFVFPINSILVESSKGPTGKTFQKLIDQERIILEFILNRMDAWVKLDSPYLRYLYYSEFQERLKILKNNILEGKLDAILILSPEELIHGMMGVSGEYLRFFGIDPKIGVTYNRFMEECKPPSTRKTGLEGILSFVKEIETNIKKGQNASDVDVAEGIPIQEGIPKKTIFILPKN